MVVFDSIAFMCAAGSCVWKYGWFALIPVVIVRVAWGLYMLNHLMSEGYSEEDIKSGCNEKNSEMRGLIKNTQDSFRPYTILSYLIIILLAII